MEGEAMALLKVVSLTIASMTYARFASLASKPGKFRFSLLIPVIVLLPFLPFFFSTLHLRAISFFFLVWLGTFKLLLLSFGLGPLSPSLPLPTFLAISSLPVKLRDAISNPHSTNTSAKYSLRHHLLSYTLKAIIFILVIRLYRYKSGFHTYVLLSVYSIHFYLGADLILASAALFVIILLGLEVERQFDAPYKSVSLQDFWGRRWNLMVTAILRPSVYHPVSARWGKAAGFLATFFVSGLMHEVMFYYVTLTGPTGEATCFFLLHGVCVVVEVGMRRKGWWQSGLVAARLMTIGFLAVTGFWLFFLPVVRAGADRIVVEECEAMVRMLEDAGEAAIRQMGLF